MVIYLMFNPPLLSSLLFLLEINMYTSANRMRLSANIYINTWVGIVIQNYTLYVASTPQ